MQALGLASPVRPAFDRIVLGLRQLPPRPADALAVLPGVGLTAVVAASALALRALPGVAVFSPMILSIAIGIAYHNVLGVPRRAHAGVAFALRRLLRFAIILLGLQLTLGQVAQVGIAGIAIIATTLAATFVITRRVGRALGVPAKLAELIAAGTSICGASAVVAVNTVTDGDDEDVAYAVACVTIFGSLSMFLYPLLPGLLHLGPRAYGLWAGASIHEIAQVVAAAFQDGSQAGQFGTIAKLARVMMLAPLVIALGWFRTRTRHGGQHAAKPTPVPWFVLGFVALVVVNSIVTVEPAVRSGIGQATGFLLSMALAAMGLQTNIRKLWSRGLRPLALGAFSWLFIAGFSLVLVMIAG
jgi:uncharacterized integral membrane protein (TIGR00698 family)